MVEIVPVERLVPGLDTRGMETLEESVRRCQGHPSSTPKDEHGIGRYLDLTSGLLRAYRKSPEVRQGIDRLFGGRIVVDLGAGRNPHGYELSCLAGAEGYVGNERFFLPELRDGLVDGDVPVALSGEDMLSLLKRLPDSSVSALICGIDSRIVPEDRGREIGASLARVVHPEGGVVCRYVPAIYLGSGLSRICHFPEDRPGAGTRSGCFRIAQDPAGA